MKFTSFLKIYLTGLWSFVVIGLLLVLLFVFYFIYQSIFIVVLILLGIVMVLIVPYYLGKKSKTKPGSYGLGKVK